MSLPALVPLHHDPAYPPPPQHGSGEPPIFLPLPDTDIGYVYRGDTIILPDWFAYDYYGDVVDLTDGTVWFTAKTDLDLADNGVDVIQCSTWNGMAEIKDAVAGRFAIRIDPVETKNLVDDTVFTFDCQVKTGEPKPRTLTVKRGVMTVVRDVTRADG